MYKTLVSTENMSREEWLEFRRMGLGGSDAATACGLNKYKSPVELWMEKTGDAEPKEAGESAYWGTIMEPHIREEFSRRTGLEVRFERSILQHPDHEFLFANLDGIIHDPIYGPCIFEAKTANAYLQDQWNDSIPDSYQLQIMHYMAVTGFAGAYIAVLIGGNTFKWQFVARDNDLISMLVSLENHFWNYVKSSTPPPIDGCDASTELLSRLYPISRSNSITLPGNALQLIQTYEAASEREKQAANEKDLAANQLKELLQDNESGVVSGRTVSWKTVNSERIDSKLFRSELPDIYAKYSKLCSSRRFCIK